MYPAVAQIENVENEKEEDILDSFQHSALKTGGETGGGEGHSFCGDLGSVCGGSI